MQQQQSTSTTIKTIHMKETPVRNRQRKKFRLCSLVPRLICETLLVLLIFLPLLLFVFQWSTVKNVIHDKVIAKTRLGPMAAGFESWSNPPVKTLRAYRLFDITNHEDIMTKQSNPLMEFQETIPLMYQVSIKKNNVQWLDDNKQLLYSVERLFTRHGEFNETLLEQHGSFVDILRAMLRTKFERIAADPFYALGGNYAFNHSKVVDKLEGFISPIFAAISARMQGPNRDKYGFIYRYNGSNGFNYTIHTGIENSAIKGKLVNFASEYTPFKTDAGQWKTEIFDGLTFPPMGNPTTKPVINVFQPDFCRPVQLRYNRTVSMLGIEHVHEYVLKLIDTEKCPEMDENCPEVDKLDITKCFSAELPEETLFLTKPHLYGHNSNWTNVAFEPNAEKHESVLYFEPLTGTPLRAQSRVQLNVNAWIDRIRVNDDGSSAPLKSRAVRRFIPMMWIDQSISLNEATTDRLKLVSGVLQKGQKAHGSLKFVYVLLAFLSTVAVVALIELFLWNLRTRKLNRKEKPQEQPKFFVPIQQVQRTGEVTVESDSHNVADNSIKTKELV